MAVTLVIGGLLGIVAGLLILLVPGSLRWIVGSYLIIAGVLALL